MSWRVVSFALYAALAWSLTMLFLLQVVMYDVLVRHDAAFEQTRAWLILDWNMRVASWPWRVAVGWLLS